MFRAGDALASDFFKARQILAEQRGFVDPESWEHPGFPDAVLVAMQFSPRREMEPAQLPFVYANDEVLLHAGSGIIVLLAGQIDGNGAVRDFDKQLGSANQVFVLIDPAHSAILGEK